jgi:hypothetical protein
MVDAEGAVIVTKVVVVVIVVSMTVCILVARSGVKCMLLCPGSMVLDGDFERRVPLVSYVRLIKCMSAPSVFAQDLQVGYSSFGQQETGMTAF